MSKREVFGLSATFLCLLMAFSACKKKDALLGANQLQPDVPLTGWGVDTFNLITSSELDDTVITKNPVSSVLGSYHDPVFGKMDAQLFTQVRITSSNPNFGDLSKIITDSMVLSLRYVGFTGKSGDQTFEVYRLTDTISSSSSVDYYSHSTLPFDPANLIESGSATVKMDANKKVVIDTIESNPQLRLRLDTLLAKTWMQEANSTNTNFASAENFVKYFNGFYIRTNNPSQSSGEGGIGYFNLADNDSKLTIYYRQKNSAGVFEKKEYVLRINSNAQRFSRVTFDRAGSKVQQVLNMPQQGQQEFYAQAFGLRGKLQIPGINNIPKNSIINRAELFIPVQYQLASAYNLGTEISVTVKLQNQGLSLVNFGTYSDFRKGFVIDMRAYLQQVVAGNVENLDLYLAPRQFISSADRIIFNGQSSINKLKPTLSVIYTEF